MPYWAGFLKDSVHMTAAVESLQNLSAKLKIAEIQIVARGGTQILNC